MEQAFKHGKYRTVHLRADFATFSPRLESLKEWPYNDLPRWQLAMAGFYHDPMEEDPAVVICFSCEAEHRCIGTDGNYSNDIVKAVLLDIHIDGYLWADIYRNATEYFLTLTRLPQEISMMGRKQHIEIDKQSDMTSHDKNSVNFSIQINRA
jgi:hypothetical protein